MIGRGICLVAALALLVGCGSLSDARDSARGVDDAVRLLEDLDERGVWNAIGDAADALEDLDHGYVAQIEVQNSGASPLTIQIRSDADDEAWIIIGPDVGDTEATQTYFISPFTDADAPANVYRVTDGQYGCANAEAQHLQNGLRGVLVRYASDVFGPELLGVTALEGDEITHLNREATRYRLDSRRAEAVEVLRELDNAELAARVESAGNFDLSGEIILDDETGALLAAESMTTASSAAGRARFFFEISQWDTVEDILAPTEDAVVTACA